MDFRAKILNLAKANGYTGEDGDTAALVKFLTDNGFEITDGKTGKAFDADGLTKALKAKRRVVIDDDAGDTDDGDEATEKAEREATKKKSREDREAAQKSARKDSKWGAGEATREEDSQSRMGWTPQGQSNMIARKIYDREAAKGQRSFSCADEAEACAAFIRQATRGEKGYAQKARDAEIYRFKGQVEYDNSAGGYLVPEDFLASVILLREKAGGAHMLAQQVDMSRDTLTLPREYQGLTFYTPGEGGEITESQIAGNNVKLTATKRAAMARYSSEVYNDAALNIADRIINWGVYGLEADLENAFINGNSTSTYWHQTGLGYAFQNLVTQSGGTWATDAANASGIVVGAGNLWSELTQANFDTVLGRRLDMDMPAPNYWVVSESFWAQVMVPKVRAAGGAVYEVFEGLPRKMFNGAPVVTTPKMPEVEGNSQFCAFYGAIGAASIVGRVRGSLAIATSEHAAFANDVTLVRFTHRACVNVHDFGTYDSTPANWTFSPYVGLLTAAS